MDNPEISVTKINKEETKNLVGKKPVNLGGRQSLTAALTEIQLGEILARLKDGDTDAFFLSWEGNKIPRGAKINGREIGWTQNGQVVSAGGEMIGTYDRLVEFGGEKGKDQRMIVYALREPLVI